MAILTMSIDAHAVQETLESLIARLPAGCASLKTSEGSVHGQWFIEVEPANPRSARIQALVDPDMVWLSLGLGGVFEVPEGGRYTKYEYLEEIRLLCSGVIAGDYEEKVRMVGTDVLASRARITLSTGATAKSYWRRVFFNPFKKRSSVHKTYEPYC